MITNSKQVTKHFHSTEFRCKCGCGKIYIDEKLIDKLETLFSKLNASKCIISSGYRCSKHDKAVGGSGTGQHVYGKAVDCVYYDKNGKIIPSKIVICVAYDLDIFRGIAKINNNYTHLDMRSSGYYKGDETVSFNSVWSNPYTYFKVSKEDVAKYTGETIKPAPTTTTNKFKKGDKIVLNGYLYKDAKGNGRGQYKTNYKGTITIVASGSKPYHIDSLGWVAENNIKLQTTANKTVYKTISNCNALNLRTSASYGNNIYKSVKAGTKVEYLGLSNGWAKIKYNGKTLYCGSGYLK